MPSVNSRIQMMDEMFALLKDAMAAQYAQMLPAGFSIHLLAEYTPLRFPAANLWLEKQEKPGAKYVAILTSDMASVPALGETITDAINAAIVKAEAL